MNMDDLKLSDLKKEHRMVAEVIGLEAYMELCRVFGGASVCIPNRNYLYQNYYKRMILADNEHSVKELMKMYHISESLVYQIRRSADTSAVKVVSGDFSIKDLPPHLGDIAEVIGFKHFLALCDAYEAFALYIPTEKALIKEYVERKILENKDYFSKKELARIYNISESTVYNILRKQEQ